MSVNVENVTSPTANARELRSAVTTKLQISAPSRKTRTRLRIVCFGSFVSTRVSGDFHAFIAAACRSPSIRGPRACTSGASLRESTDGRRAARTPRSDCRSHRPRDRYRAPSRVTAPARWAMGAVGGNQPGRRPWTEAEGSRRRVRRHELDDPQSVSAVGDVGKHAGVGHRHLHVARVVHRTIGRERLVDARPLGTFDVDDGQAVRRRWPVVQA